MRQLIKDDYFTEKWIKSRSKQISADAILLEKTLHAFALLGYLVQLETEFLFKGGTSLLMHFPVIKRLSIDIDIVFGGEIDEFKKKLSAIVNNKPFTRIKENNRGERGLPNRRHFKFFYISSLSNKEDSILLDIVLDDPSYLSSILNKRIEVEALGVKIDLKVSIPTIEGLLGDKLTAFAPHTTGVPFITNGGKSMTMQVAKQLFDIGELFNYSTDFNKIQKAFNQVFIKEAEYRKSKFSKEEMLKDTIQTCIELCEIRLKGFKSTDVTNYLEDGIKKLDSHLLNEKFRTDNEAKITAAKVFCIANKILKIKHFNIEDLRYNTDMIEQIRDIKLPAPYERLNRLKPVLPEAFYYIWQGIID